ncbi:MAG: hypothetical protein R2864_01130 [Syntrophotaleaceae bacterium]
MPYLCGPAHRLPGAFLQRRLLASQSNHSVSTLVDDYHARHEVEFMETVLIDSFKFRGEREGPPAFTGLEEDS